MLISKKNSSWRHCRLEDARQLPSRYYYDEGLFRQELEKIFYPAWHFACHGSEIREPGDYVKVDVYDQSMIVVRGDDGEVNAFHNACQHRGTRFLGERRGTVKRRITCPYHAWTYTLDGSLRNAPHERDVAGFDKCRYSLKRVRVEEWHGYVFVNMDPDAEPFLDMVRDAEDLIVGRFPDIEEVELVSTKSYDVDANWKIIVENAIEGYHFKTSGGRFHRQLTRLIRYEEYDPSAGGKWWIYQGRSDEVPAEVYGEEIGDAQYQTDWFFNIQIWPHTTLYTFPYADFIGTFNLWPLSPEKTRVGFDYYRPARPASKVTEACMKFMTCELGPEDIELNLVQQRGMRSFGYDQGPYMVNAARKSWSEHLLFHFHSLIHEALEQR